MIFVMEDPEFCRNVVALRKKYCLSRKAFCKLTGVSPALLSDIENDRELFIDFDAMKGICRVFNVRLPELSDFFCEDEEALRRLRECANGGK